MIRRVKFDGYFLNTNIHVNSADASYYSILRNLSNILLDLPRNKNGT